MNDTPSPTPEEIEAAARALMDDAYYEALPEQISYRERKWSQPSEWYDRSEMRETAERALKAAMAVRRGNVMDYRKILVAYMKRVIDCETYDYTYEAIGRRANFPGLTADEMEELLACCQEAWEDRESPSKDLDDALQDVPIPDTPLMAAVRRGK